MLIKLINITDNSLTFLFKVCDFGPFRNHLIPPTCVTLTKKRSSVRRKLQLLSVKSPNWKNWKPLIVLGVFILSF